jgi:transmembrane sensor
MSKLRAPLRELLDDRLPEPDVQRIWRALQRRTSRRVQRPSALPLMAAACLVLLSLAGWLGLRGTQAVEGLAIAGADALGPRRVLDGDVASVWPLSDGSRIQLSGSSRLEVLENTGHTFAMRLESGRGDFEVKPGGPRRWRVECGELSVEVVGTSFVVNRDAEGVSVEVRHGVVRVRSARIPGGVQQLTAGGHVHVPEARSQAATSARQGASNAPLADAAPATSVALQPMAASPAAAGLEQVAGSRPSAGNSVTPSRGESTRPGSDSSASGQLRAARRGAGDEPAAVLRSADRARRTGDTGRAEALFERVRGGWPGTPHAALASLTLARMRMQAEPERAAQDLAAALAADLPEGLREDAMARLVEANARAGHAERAERAAQAYRRAFPNGRRAAEVERWMRQP